MHQMMEIEIININRNKFQIGDTQNLMPKVLVKFRRTTSMVLHSKITFLIRVQDKEDGHKIEEAIVQRQMTSMFSIHS